MRIRIVCPVSCAYEGDAAFVSIPSTDGEFGVLPAHSSEICTIDRGYVRVSDKAMGTVDHTFAVAGGYAQVADDVVTFSPSALAIWRPSMPTSLKLIFKVLKRSWVICRRMMHAAPTSIMKSHGVSSSLPNSQTI